MKKMVCVVACCYLALGLHAQTTPPAKDIDRMIVLTNGDYNMGKITAGKPLEYNVTIKNISKDTLVLQSVKAGCGCTTPKYITNDRILPGKSALITLGFNGSANGPFTKFADLFFNDGLSKQVRFSGIAVADSTRPLLPVVQ